MANFFNASRPRRPGLQPELIPPENPAIFRHSPPVFRQAVSDAEFYDLGPADCEPHFREHCETGSEDASPGEAFLSRARRDLLSRVPHHVERGVRGARAVFWSSVVVLSAASFWFAGGHALAERMNPEPPLMISAVQTRILDDDGSAMVLVEGWVKNSTGKPRDLPFLLLQTDDGGDPVAVDTGRNRLEPGESVSFTGRIAMPSRDDANLRITFADGNRLAERAS